MKFKKVRWSFLVLVLIVIFLGVQIVTAFSYCNASYTSGNWIVNSSLTCSNEVIPVDGSLTIKDDSNAEVLASQFVTQTNAAYNLIGNSSSIDITINSPIVSAFNSATNAYYNLVGNSTTISAAIPDLNKSTPSQLL